MYGPRDWQLGRGIFGWLVLLAMIGLTVAVGITLVRLARRRPEWADPLQRLAPAEGGALRELRLRYARAKVDRDELLTKLRDLGGVPANAPVGPE